MSFTDDFPQVDFKNETQIRLILSNKDAEAAFLRNKVRELTAAVQRLEGKTTLSPWQEKALVDGLRGMMRMLRDSKSAEEILESAEAGGVEAFLFELDILEGNRAGEPVLTPGEVYASTTPSFIGKFKKQER